MNSSSSAPNGFKNFMQKQPALAGMPKVPPGPGVPFAQQGQRAAQMPMATPAPVPAGGFPQRAPTMDLSMANSSTEINPFADLPDSEQLRTPEQQAQYLQQQQQRNANIVGDTVGDGTDNGTDNRENPFKIGGGPGETGANPMQNSLGINTLVNVFDQMTRGDDKRDYEAMLRKMGNTDAKGSGPQTADAFGNYTLNAGLGNNFRPGQQTPVQRFQFAEGGQVSDEMDMDVEDPAVREARQRRANAIQDANLRNQQYKEEPLDQSQMGKLPNLNDFLVDKNELEYMNDPKNGLCPKGKNCLQNANEAYDLMVGQRNKSTDFPSVDRYKKNLHLQSMTPETYARLSPEQKAQADKVPYYDKTISNQTAEKPNALPGNFSADSWDIQGVIVDQGGKNYFTDELKGSKFKKMSPAQRKTLYDELPIGAIVGMGDDRYDLGSNRGFNGTKGLSNNRHSGTIVRYDTDGTPIMFDMHEYRRIDNPYYDNMQIANISAPKEMVGKNRAWLQKQGLLEDRVENLNIPYDKLGGDKTQMGQFNDALAFNKKGLMNDLNLKNDDYDRYARLLNAVAAQETGGGTAPEHKIQKSLGTSLGDTQGLTQLNIDNLLNNPQLAKVAAKYGITTERDLFDPEKSAIASMIYAKSNQVMANQNYEKGMQPGLRDFRKNSRSKQFNSDGFYIEETNSRVTTTRTGGMLDRPLSEIQTDLDKQAKGVYQAKEVDGEVVITKHTRGNAREMDDDAKFAYAWQSPKALFTGDAQGNSGYVKNVKQYLTKLRQDDRVAKTR